MRHYILILTFVFVALGEAAHAQLAPQIPEPGIRRKAADSAGRGSFPGSLPSGGLQPSPELPTVIVVLGSSTAAGTGASTPARSWVARYRRYVRSLDATPQVVNLASGGFTTYDIMPTGFAHPPNRPSAKPHNNITRALAYRPSAVIMHLPSNDVAFGYSVAEQLANYDTLHSRLLDANIPFWITTGQPRNITDPVVRNRLRTITDSLRARYGNSAIDVWDGLAAPDGTLLQKYDSGDNIHVNDAGHLLIFERVVAAGIWPVIAAIKKPWRIPESFALRQNSPNPFNPETSISFSIAAEGPVTLKVFDILGREVVSLVDENKPIGDYTVQLDGSNLSSGVYYYRLMAGGFIETKQMILLK